MCAEQARGPTALAIDSGLRHRLLGRTFWLLTVLRGRGMKLGGAAEDHPLSDRQTSLRIPKSEGLLGSH